MLEEELGPINKSLAERKVTPSAIKEDDQKFSHYIKRMKGYAAGNRILDIGCFTGNFLALARRHGFQASGIEFYEPAVELGRRIHGLEIRQGFFEEIAPELVRGARRTYDVISLWETLEHMIYPNEVLKTCNELLDEKGIVAITVPNFDCLHVRFLREKCFHALGGPGNPGHMNMFTEHTLRAIAIQNNFDVVHLETEAGTDYADVLNYLSLDFERINSYRTVVKAQSKQSRRPQDHAGFLPPPLIHALHRLSPLWRLAENAFNRGALLSVVLRRRSNSA